MQVACTYVLEVPQELADSLPLAVGENVVIESIAGFGWAGQRETGAGEGRQEGRTSTACGIASTHGRRGWARR